MIPKKDFFQRHLRLCIFSFFLIQDPTIIQSHPACQIVYFPGIHCITFSPFQNSLSFYCISYFFFINLTFSIRPFLAVINPVSCQRQCCSKIIIYSDPFIDQIFFLFFQIIQIEFFTQNEREVPYSIRNTDQNLIAIHIFISVKFLYYPSSRISASPELDDSKKCLYPCYKTQRKYNNSDSICQSFVYDHLIFQIPHRSFFSRNRFSIGSV